MCGDDLKELIKRQLLPTETIDLIFEISLLLHFLSHHHSLEKKN